MTLIWEISEVVFRGDCAYQHLYCASKNSRFSGGRSGAPPAFRPTAGVPANEEHKDFGSPSGACWMSFLMGSL